MERKDLLDGVLEELLEDKDFIDPEELEEEKEEKEEKEEQEEQEEEFEDDEEDEEEDDGEVILDEYGEELTVQPRKRTKEDRERYAFEKLRKENLEKEARLRELDDIASAYGFTDREAMMEQLRTEAEQKQAKAKGIDPNIYKTLKEQERELAKIKEEREQDKMRVNANVVMSRIEGFKSKHSLDDSDVENLLGDLDADGFTIEHLSRMSNYEKLFTGYLRDTIVEKERQKKLETEERKKKLQEDKLDGGGRAEEYTLDDLISATLERNKTEY